MNDAETIAAELLAARRNRQPLDHLPGIDRSTALDFAYQVQVAHVAGLLGEGGTKVGYKIGCTNGAARQLLNIDEPFYGCLVSTAVDPSPARIRRADLFQCIIEPEMAFIMADDLPPAAAPYDPDGVADAIGAIMPAVEVVDSRYRDWSAIGAPGLIADNGSTGRWVHGTPISDWRSVDLAEQQVRLLLNGEEIRTGSGANVLDHPINAVTWLANNLCLAGQGLTSGDRVSTGTCTDVYVAAEGDSLIAEFGEFGHVTIDIV